LKSETKSNIFQWLYSGLRSRNESEVFGWSRSRIPNNTGSPSRIFCLTLDLQLYHFLYWEFLLKWYSFFWNFCWNREFLLCTTISIDFSS